MFCLTKKSPIRIFFIKFIESNWFQRIVTMNIFLCSICLFWYSYADLNCKNIVDPTELDTCLLTYQSDINRDKILDKIFIGFNIIFLLEMLCKVIAKGFILHKKAYLRSFWNIIDCFATVYSILELITPSLGKMVILRVIRLLRILNNIKYLESIKKPISCIMFAIPTIANVLLFLGFIFTVFATLGIQLFSGSFYKRCRKEPVSYFDFSRNRTIYSAVPITDFLCNGNYNDSSILYGRCPKESYCVSYYDIPGFFNLTEKNVTINNFDIAQENWETNYKIIYGIPNFDMIINCYINVFIVMTYQNWSDIAGLILDSNSSLMVILYFNSMVIFGGFFMMRMIFAAQNEVFIKVKEDEKGQKLQMIKKYSRFYPNFFVGLDLEKIMQNFNTMNIVDMFQNAEKFLLEHKKKESKKKVNQNGSSSLLNKEEKTDSIEVNIQSFNKDEQFEKPNKSIDEISTNPKKKAYLINKNKEDHTLEFSSGIYISKAQAEEEEENINNTNNTPYSNITTSNNLLSCKLFNRKKNSKFFINDQRNFNQNINDTNENNNNNNYINQAAQKSEPNVPNFFRELTSQEKAYLKGNIITSNLSENDVIYKNQKMELEEFQKIFQDYNYKNNNYINNSNNCYNNNDVGATRLVSSTQQVAEPQKKQKNQSVNDFMKDFENLNVNHAQEVNINPSLYKNIDSATTKNGENEQFDKLKFFNFQQINNNKNDFTRYHDCVYSSLPNSENASPTALRQTKNGKFFCFIEAFLTFV